MNTHSVYSYSHMISHHTMAGILLITVLFFLQTEAKIVPAPKYVINITHPAMERWAQVAKDYAHYYPKLFEQIESKLPKELLDEIASITPILNRYIPDEFYQEMKGIAKYGKVSLERVVLLNFLYDIYAYDHKERSKSVSVIVEIYDENNPLIVGHVFDYIYSDILRNLTINVEGRNNNPYAPVFLGTSFAGMIGLYMGVSAGCCSVSITERITNVNETWREIFTNLKAGYNTTSFITRSLMQSDQLITFQEAAVILSNSRIVAPCYLMIGGQYDGVLVTRDCNGAFDKAFLSGQTEWYLIGTNYDPWESPPSDDNRKQVVIHQLESAGRGNIDTGNLVKALLVSPIVNDRTAFVAATTPDYWGPYSSVIYYPDN